MSPAYADLHSSGPTSMTPEGFFQGLKLSRVNRATIKMFSAKGKDGKSQKVKCLLLLLLPLQLLFSGRLRQLCHVCQLWREVGLGEIGPGLWQPLTGPCKRKRFFDENAFAAQMWRAGLRQASAAVPRVPRVPTLERSWAR